MHKTGGGDWLVVELFRHLDENAAF